MHLLIVEEELINFTLCLHMLFVRIARFVFVEEGLMNFVP
jgi:hypothetical protein